MEAARGGFGPSDGIWRITDMMSNTPPQLTAARTELEITFGGMHQSSSPRLLRH